MSENARAIGLAMLIEIDEVAIDRKLWARVFEGDPESIKLAREEVMKEINGLQLYLHALNVSEETHVVVTLRQLEGLNLIESVRCSV